MATQPRSITQPNYFRTGLSEEVADIAAGLILAPGTAVDAVLKATGATDELLGVSVETMEPGVQRSYQVDGKVPVLSGAAVAAGALVTADATARAVTASGSATSTARILGRAVTASSGAGELIEVELSKGAFAFIGTATVADRAALKAIAAGSRFTGQLILVQSDGSLWRFDGASTLTDDTADELVQEPDAGAGAWLRADKAFVMKIPIAFGLADAAAIETIPEGFALRLTGHPYWEIVTPFAGGVASTIGISTSLTGYDTKGDLLGGAAGDSTAVESAGIAVGTLGGELNDEVGFHAVLLEEGSEIRYDEITSAYTAGAGFVRIPVAVALAPATP